MSPASMFALMENADMWIDAVVSLGLSNLIGAVMGNAKDHTGLVYGKLTAVRRVDNRRGKVMWLCTCECGGTTEVDAGSLTSGNTSSCGCVVPNLKHGGSTKSSYYTWRAMIRRCTNPVDKDYRRYGARGVTVDPRWVEYTNFVADMGEPVGDETLDRIDTYGNYTKENCRWAGLTTQARNRRLHSKNKSGHTGVSAEGANWRAKLTTGKKSYYSKLFGDINDAIAARYALELAHFGG